MSIEVKVPDIGDYKDVPIIDVLVKEGDIIEAEQSLITLESDKATIDVPSPSAGKVKTLKVKNGDKVSQHALILILESVENNTSNANKSTDQSDPKEKNKLEKEMAKISSDEADEGDEAKNKKEKAKEKISEPFLENSPKKPATPTAINANDDGEILSHASPSVRQFARKLGLDISRVKGTGPNGRIREDDIHAYVKQILLSHSQASSAGQSAGELNLLPWPSIDFSKFGEIEAQPLSRIKKIAGANLHRNWVMIPHVTNHEEADITNLETFRVKLNKENEKTGIKITMLAFLIKASAAALKKFPSFNTSLKAEALIYKKYIHIGFAADTPNGLVVPVIRDADKKSILDIAKETTDMAKLARDGKLKPEQMQGGCFSISSLGGIGGTYFTPIINAPEVAILGVSRSSFKPVWEDSQFVSRLMLPLSLSYDHRVIDGAEAARFNAFLASVLADFRRISL